MGNKITVACKLPRGLWLRVYGFVETQESVMGGGTRLAKKAVQKGDRIHINGYLKPNAKVQQPSQEASYAVTQGVDEDFMKLWESQREEGDPLVKDKIIIWAHPDKIEGLIRENSKRRSGFEALDPEKLPSVAKGVSSFDGKKAA